MTSRRGRHRVVAPVRRLMITAALAALAATALPLSATAATARPAGAHPAGAHPVRDRGAGASVVQERADRGQGATGPRDPRHYLTDISATLAADGGISGTVTTAGHAVSGACVGAYPGTSASPAGLAITGAGGAYQIAGLIPGRYHVEFSSGCGATGYRIQWYHGAASRAGSAPVTVTAGTTTPGIDAS